jgi:hypothetical protein
MNYGNQSCAVHISMVLPPLEIPHRQEELPRRNIPYKFWNKLSKQLRIVGLIKDCSQTQS